MRLPALIVSDLHLTAEPAAEYRWSLFPWIHEQVELDRVKTLLILGDLTDAKDNHSAELVNRVAKNIAAIQCQVIILTGNHDWLKAGHEFFKFLNLLPNVRFITEPSEDTELKGPSAYFLPYSKNPMKDWQGMDFSHYDYLFMHQTVAGSICSNGQAMEGEALPPLNARKVYSGDIHVPQVIGKVEYVGSPYHVHFGDAFKPRAILIDKDCRAIDLHFETISRVTLKVKSLRELRRAKFRAGDQVKLRIELGESEKHEWSKIKREAGFILADQGVIVSAIELVVQKSTRRVVIGATQTKVLSPSDYLQYFVEREELGISALDIALEVIES